MRLFTFLVLTLLTIHPLSADRAIHLKKMVTEQRVALVIGNNDYKTMPALKNPVNDARAIRQSLKSRGFDVIYKENATKRDMKKLLKKFSHKLTRGGVGMYFFAGHGINVGGRNFLVGIDAVLDEEEDVEFEAIALDYVISKMKKAGNRLNIIALDACRNNPFGRSGGGGLAPIGNARGLFVAYATEAGAVASDNKTQKHGLFTKHLLASINQPGANLSEVFKIARQGVYKESNGKQSPGIYDQTLGEFYFTLPKTQNILTSRSTITQEPNWLVSLIDFPNCVIGFARKNAQNQKQEALLTSVIEMGFTGHINVSGMQKTYAQDTVHNNPPVSVTVVKITGTTTSKGMTEKFNWKSPNNDYFSLVCQNKNGSKFNKTAATIKSYSEKGGSGIIKISMENNLFYDIKTPYREIILNNKQLRPGWIHNQNIKKHKTAIGISSITDGDYISAYIKASVDARLELAWQFKSDVENLIKAYRASTTDKNKTTIVANTTITNRVTSQNIYGSKLLRLWVDKPNQNIYVLMGLDYDASFKNASTRKKHLNR